VLPVAVTYPHCYPARSISVYEQAIAFQEKVAAGPQHQPTLLEMRRRNSARRGIPWEQMCLAPDLALSSFEWDAVYKVRGILLTMLA
jgi:hypothetical protein